MVVLGVDAHKRSHTIVAVDANGKELGSKTVKTTAAGHVALLKWAQQWPQRLWAIEDCRSFSRSLEQDLLRAGESGVRVAPKLTALHRQVVRKVGKSDPIDALAVARAALREEDLPVIQLEGQERDLRLLVDHREDIVAERTRMQNRLHLHFHELEPAHEITSGSLDRLCVLEDLLHRLQRHSGVVANIAKELVERILELTKRANALEKQITALAKAMAPNLLELAGCGPLGAAKLVGEVAGISRFKSKDAFAMHNGTAPIPVWSGNRDNFRLNQGGNRQINSVIHRIAITQIRYRDDAKAYVERRMATGETKRKAIRALKRKISNEVFKRMKLDEQMRRTDQNLTVFDSSVQAA